MTRLYIGTYTQEQGEASAHRPEGIFLCELDEQTGQLRQMAALEAGRNPGFLVLHPSGRYLYAINEETESQASSLVVDPFSGRAELMNQQPTKGMHSCYVSLDPSGRWLLVANYSSGNLSVLPIVDDGRLGPLTDFVQHTEPTGPNHQRQDHAHAHSIRPDPSGKFIISADLGTDRIDVYQLDTSKGKLIPNAPAGIQVNPGSGPRHTAFHINGRVLYVANELDGTVSSFTWDPEKGVLQPLETLSTLPEGFRSENTVADIHLTPDGRYLYVSNRGDNSIAAYRVGAQDGRLERLGIFSCGGNWPRNFAIDPQGRFLLCANQYSGDVVVFRIEDDGKLTPTGEKLPVPAPVCVIFA